MEKTAGGGGYDAMGGSKEKLTASVVITCIVAASCGLIYGYDVGITGGVTTMEPFLKKFFPSILRKMAESKGNTYCIFDSQVLTSFTSSLYLAGMASSLFASSLTRRIGRKATMVLGGFTFFVGSALNAAAANVAMLILGRILLGLGVGFTNQAAPVYLSEMAPAKLRGMFTFGFQFFLGTGVVAANVLNYRAVHFGNWGWRLSLGLAAAPAALMTVGAILVSDTPRSLVQRGKLEQARKSLSQARGVDVDIEDEFNDLVKSNEVSKSSTTNKSLTTILQRKYRPHLVIAVLIPFFQQMTGINVIAFYAPVLFRSVGFGSEGALIASVVLGVVNLLSIVISMFVVDRFGRRALFLEGGVQMILFQVAVAGLLGAKLGLSGDKPLSDGDAIWVLVLMCIYAAGFGWSWGPLSWLIPSEIFPMEIRPVGQSISIAINFLATFVLAQTFLAMLCHFKYYTFVFYAGWIIVMTVFVAFFLPETKGIALESMHIVWEKHWYWHRFVDKKPT